jgi:glutathione peroxidase
MNATMARLVALGSAASILAAGGFAQKAESAPVASPVHELTMKRLDGADQALGAYRGKIVLVVNVASECGYTPQYAGLQKLHDRFAARGFSVLGFPCNDFGGQEPGSADAIEAFCKKNYGVTFPLFAKVSIKRDDPSPLYRYLQHESPVKAVVKWNFHKFLLDRDGRVLASFGTKTAPDDPNLIDAIEKALGRAAPASRPDSRAGLRRSAENPTSAVFESPIAAAGADSYGGWMMWWSTNREEFLSSSEAQATSQQTYGASAMLVTPDLARAEIIPVLLNALKDPERQIREAAAISLGMCGERAEASALVAALGDKDRAVAEAAVMGLGLLGAPEADKPLAKILADPSESERKRGLAALSLGLSGTDEGKKPLLDELGSGKSDKLEACRMLGTGLWSGGDGPSGPADRRALAAIEIQKGLTRQDTKRRKLVSMGTASLCKPRDQGSRKFVLDTLKDPRFDVRAAAAIAAGRVITADDKAGIKVLIDALAAEGHTLPSRFMLISLGRIGGPEAIGSLKTEVRSAEKIRCAFAALALGIAGATDVALSFRQSLAGPTDERVRGAFAIALGLMKDAKAFAPIVQIVHGKPNDELLLACVWFFAVSHNPEARMVLESVVTQSKVNSVQEAAATALGVIGATESQPFLSQLLLGKSPEALRKAAALGLGRMRDQRGVEPLVKVARADDSVSVRAAAIAALGAVARRVDRPPFARVAIDAYYGIQNEAIDEIATRAGSLMKTTEEGGGQKAK